ncbi:MAG TPA: chorismate-binding protein [Actinomycetes bacterium]|nr:chorismate-binding protein [Actinomycetes bacterium]
MPDLQAFAYFDGRLATELIEVSHDPSVLDGHGWWAVVLTYEGIFTAARFARVEAAPFPEAKWLGAPREDWSSSMSREQYVAAVQTVREAIAAGEVYQANICRVLTTGISAECSMSGLGHALDRHHPAPHAGAVVVESHDLEVVTATPELFLRRQGSIIESSPIKGTAKTADGLLDKDAAENVMIVDLVRNDLGMVCDPGSISVPSLLKVEAHPGLVHLVSTVRGELRPEHGWADILAATFPPGSVTGAPKSSALSIIDELEPVPRGPYCGAVGWVNADSQSAQLGVGIRTFWREGSILHFGTGAGITWGSDPEQEWEETKLKADRLLAVAAEGSDR